jgi:hypothetical protein
MARAVAGQFTEKQMAEIVEMKPPADPFDPANLRLEQSFDSAGVKKLLRTVPVKRPHKQQLVRVHPSESYRLTAAIIELEEDREVYLVQPHVARELPFLVSPVTIFAAVTRAGVVFLWPVKLPTPDGKVIEWHRTALEAAEHATKHWIFVRANMALGAYEIVEAPATIPDPEWPELSFKDLLRIGFKDRLIGDYDHPVLKRLRGES